MLIESESDLLDMYVLNSALTMYCSYYMSDSLLSIYLFIYCPIYLLFIYLGHFSGTIFLILFILFITYLYIL